MSLPAGSLCALWAADGEVLRVFVNVAERPANLAAIAFGPHGEVAVVNGITGPAKMFPSKSGCPAGITASVA